MPFYICCAMAVADTSCSLVWISNVRHLKHHGIISFTTGYWYHRYPSTIFHNLKLHSLAWESDRHVFATQVYCSIIFIPDLNEPPQKIRKRGSELWIVVYIVWRSALSLSHWMFPLMQFIVLSSWLSSAVTKRQHATRIIQGICF